MIIREQGQPKGQRIPIELTPRKLLFINTQWIPVKPLLLNSYWQPDLIFFAILVAVLPKDYHRALLAQWSNKAHWVNSWKNYLSILSETLEKNYFWILIDSQTSLISHIRVSRESRLFKNYTGELIYIPYWINDRAYFLPSVGILAIPSFSKL